MWDKSRIEIFKWLHHVWIYGLALLVSLSVFKPSYGWVNLVVVPVQVVFLGAIIGLAELPLMLGLTVMWSVGSVLLARLKSWLRK